MRPTDILKDPLLHLALIAVVLACLGLKMDRRDDTAPIQPIAPPIQIASR